MAQQSLKNLDSFSRGYIEDVRSKVDFDTTRRAITSDSIEVGTTIVMNSIPALVFDGSIPAEIQNPLVGKVISGKGIIGTPRVTSVSADRLTITFDQPQTLDASLDPIALTFSDTNSGIDQYELTGSAKSRSKEDIRIDDLIPEELLEYATNSAYGSNDTGGIRTFLESYYKYMNLEEFTYKDVEVFEDIVIDNQAIFRINVPNKFFQRNLVLAAKFFDADGIPLLVGDEDGSPTLVGEDILLNDSALLTVGQSYQITSLGDGSEANIALGINNITGQEENSYAVNDVFVATDDGTGYDATQGSSPVSVKLLSYPTVIDDIFTKNISISNANKLPGRLENSAEPTGRTLNIYGLSPRLNKRKIRMETYVYNYIESGPSYRLNTIEDSLNLNEAQEEFLDLMQKEIAPALDKTSPVNKRAVYEKIIDFYKIRGSFESIETFFKLLYNEQEVQVNYPWDNTLKPSSGLYDPKSAFAVNYSQTQLIESSDNTNNDTFGRSISVSGDSFASGSPKQEAATIDIATDAAANAGSNNRTIPLANTTGLQVGMVVTSVTDASNITSNSKIVSIVNGVSITLDKNIAENIGNGDTIRFTGQVNAGAVYVFTTTDKGTSYTEEAKIVSTATDADTGFSGDNFGRCVELDGDTLAISAPSDETTFSTASTGSVEIWERSKNASGNNVWSFNTKIIAPVAGERFANGNESVSLSGDYLAVGHVGFNDDPTNKPEGAVVIYKRVGSTWVVLQTLRAPTTLNSGAPANKGFGETVVLKGKYLVASFQNYSTASVSKTGRAVVYKKNDITGLYEQDGILQPTNDIANQLFSKAIDITNVENGSPRLALTSRDNPYHTIYIFERGHALGDSTAADAPSWHPLNSLPSTVIPSIRDNTNYGGIVRISGDNLVIGENGYDEVNASNNGKIYHYEYNNDTNIWDPKLQYRGDTTVAESNFGFGLDLSDDDKGYLIVGSPGKIDGTGNQKGFVRSFNRPALSGSYTTSAGFLSEKNIKVHDSDFYQKFSYVVKVGRNLAQWKEPFDKLVHPAGFKYFGEVLLVLQAVRNVLGDTTSNTTVGIGADTVTYLNSYSASPAFRKTMSSMPGIQPGYIGIEDIGLLIEAVASVFGIIGLAKTNRDAKLTVSSVAANGAITGISIAEAGHGYASAPTLTITGTGAATCTINSKGEVNSVTITTPGTGYSTQTNIVTQKLSEVSNSGTVRQIGKTSSTTLGLQLIGLNNKSYTSTPLISISAPDAREANGQPSASNVQATATLTRNAGTGKITGFTITNPGNGYLNDAKITVEYAPEKRVPDYTHKKIIPSNHDVEIKEVLPENNYFNRKDRIPVTEYNVTVQSKSDNSGNAFYIDNNEATALSLVRGKTYRFIQSDLSNVSHPLKFSRVLNGTHVDALEYTTNVTYVGFPGTSGSYTQITIPQDAPLALYYYCSNHIGMGSSLAISGKNVAKEKPAFLGQKKFQGNYNINNFSNITIEDINTTINDGTAINKLNIQASLSDAIKETTL